MRKLILLVGPTCTGKSTLEKRLNQLGIPSLISFTTRKIRTGEVDGVDYDFITFADALALHADGHVIQHVEFAGNIYGTTQSGLDKSFAQSDRVVVVVEPTGLTQFLAYAQRQGDLEIVSVYLHNELSTLVTRLVTRFNGDGNAEAAYYWRRLVDLTAQHHQWPIYNDTDWSIFIGELDDTDGFDATDAVARQILAKTAAK